MNKMNLRISETDEERATERTKTTAMKEGKVDKEKKKHTPTKMNQIHAHRNKNLTQ